MFCDFIISIADRETIFLGKVHNDRSLHIPSASSNNHAQSQSGSFGSTASRATSIDDGELSNSRAGLDPVTQV